MQFSHSLRFAELLRELQEVHDSEIARALHQEHRLDAGEEFIEVDLNCRIPRERLAVADYDNADDVDDGKMESFPPDKSMALANAYTSATSFMFAQQKPNHGIPHKPRLHWDELPSSANCVSFERFDSTLTSDDPQGLRWSDEELKRFGLHIILRDFFRVWDPGCRKKAVWDILSGLLIGYDIITIPMVVFDPEETDFTEAMGWMCLIFWTLDMLVSLNSGFYRNGQLVMSRRPILVTYLKSWFMLDCIAVVPDWCLRILNSSTNLGKVGRLVRVARGMRVLRLLRFLKLSKVLNDIYDTINSEYMFIVVGLIRLLLLVLLLNHFVACLWYLVGRLGLELGGPNWIEDSGSYPVYRGDLPWKYSTSLHWSITQFTPAAMDISATNTGERIYSVFIIFWGLLGLSSFVGSVTASITALRNISNDQLKQFWLLRKYMRQRRVSSALAVKILRYLEYQAAAKKDLVSASQVTLLNHLSEHLGAQLLRETNASIMDKHSFFLMVALHLETVMDQVCHRALQSVEYAEEDVAFSDAHEASCMMFVKVGSFFYSRSGGLTLVDADWISEASLWMPWWHRGSLTAKAHVNELIEVMHVPFGEVMSAHPKSWFFAHQYATEFVAQINDVDHSELNDVTCADGIDTASLWQSTYESVVSARFSKILR